MLNSTSGPHHLLKPLVSEARPHPYTRTSRGREASQRLSRNVRRRRKPIIDSNTPHGLSLEDDKRIPRSPFLPGDDEDAEHVEGVRGKFVGETLRPGFDR